jgi:potassium-transporting ATPase ATP-binding subunit
MAEKAHKRPLFDPAIVKRAIKDSFIKLNPRTVARNPVMFVVEIGSSLTTGLMIRDIALGNTGNLLFTIQVTLWLWFTLLFANFAEAMAEGRGKAQADTLRKAKTETVANRINTNKPGIVDLAFEITSGPKLRKGDLVLVRAGEFIRVMAKSSKVSLRLTNRQSPEKARRLFGSPAATVRR